MKVTLLNFISAAGICVALLLGVIAYFPDKPHKPPSVTSSLREQQLPLKEEVIKLLRQVNFFTYWSTCYITVDTN